MSDCTRGWEFTCAVSPQPYCHCKCKGKHHGKYPWLKGQRDREGPWSASEARQKLEEAQAYVAQGVLPPGVLQAHTIDRTRP